MRTLASSLEVYACSIQAHSCVLFISDQWEHLTPNFCSQLLSPLKRFPAFVAFTVYKLPVLHTMHVILILCASHTNTLTHISPSYTPITNKYDYVTSRESTESNKPEINVFSNDKIDWINLLFSNIIVMFNYCYCWYTDHLRSYDLFLGRTGRN